MAFNDWQLDRLRRGLHSYRLLRGQDGGLLPWKSVENKIERFRIERQGRPSGASASTFREEALRRFAEGKSTLQADKLEHLERFLVSVGLLTEEELSESGMAYPESVETYSRLASPATLARFVLDTLSDHYVSSRDRGSDFNEHVELDIRKERGASLLRVEESVSETRRTRGPYDHKDRYAAKFFRKGFAFACTRQAVLNVFVQGGAPDELIHYCQFGARRNPDGTVALTFVRSGDGWAEKDEYELGSRLCAQVVFVPAAPTASTKERDAQAS